MRWIASTLAVGLFLIGGAGRCLAWDPESTVETAIEILHPQTNLSLKQIPDSLLAEAHGVAIIPDVFKIGFVAAIRRGHGVVMVRDAQGVWTLPQFITLTGGSVGWQAGVQGTDVVLVFLTKKSIDGLMSGKFTIGADASAAAGPVGRNASAATDARFKAEILSYSRSRGLFAGVSLDGSVIEMNPVAQEVFYGSPPGMPPARVPESALQLVQEITNLTSAARLEPPAGSVAGQPPVAPMPVVAPLRDQLAAGANQLNAILPPAWRQYLALPPEVFSGTQSPPLPALEEALGRYNQVVRNPAYENLYTRPEFQNTYALLRDYVEDQARQTNPTIALPPPPTGTPQPAVPQSTAPQPAVPQPTIPQAVPSVTVPSQPALPR